MVSRSQLARRRTIGALIGIGTLVAATQVGGLSSPSVQAEVPAQAAVTPQPYVTGPDVFTVDDIIGSSAAFGGAPTNREDRDPTIVLGNDAGESTAGNIVSQDKNVLSPIDSSFTTDEIDFFGAIPRDRDGAHVEGYAGNIYPKDTTGNPDPTQDPIGLEVSDVATDLFRAGAPLGTWAAGLGGESIKASTEHFTVMESILTCYQTYDYDYWSSKEDYLANPGSPTLDRTSAALIAAGEPPCNDPSRALTNPNDLVGFNGEDIDFATLPANEDSVVKDMAIDPDNAYSATTKDDGKLLFRWGTSVKKPTDIRFQKTIPLPPEWTDAASLPVDSPGYRVTRAELVVNHNITNNPNDQIRPEDWENEAASGRGPSYTQDASGNWYSTTDCFEGDGDFIPAGTQFKYPTGAIPNVPASDLQQGFTPAWFTTIQRDPFQWSFRNAAGELFGAQTPAEIDALQARTDLELVSGPRWRLTSNKFGQDLPGLEIPREECTQPPYQKGQIRYETGEPTTTTINLLDWSPADDKWTDAEYSPFAYSAGWITDWNDLATAVPGQVILPEDEVRCDTTDADGNCVTDLGTTLTDGFDVSFYVKGDVKPAQIYDVQLIIEWDPTPVDALTPYVLPVEPPVVPPVVPPVDGSHAFLPVTPVRVLDTRNAGAAALGDWDGSGPLQGGSTVAIPVRSAIPAGSPVAVVNVTATRAAEAGFLTVYPCDTPLPNASNLNYLPGVNFARAALAYAPVSATGQVCVYSSATTDLIVDVSGYTPSGGYYTPRTPQRLADTRNTSPLAANATLRVTPPATGGDALAISVTSVNPSAPGFLTAYSCDDGLPTISTLNYTTGTSMAIANLTIVGTGDICVTTSAQTDVLVDLQGHFTEPVALGKARLLDTRSGAKPTAGSTTRFDPTTIPAFASSPMAAVNVTATRATSPGFLTVWNCADPLPNASALNYEAGDTFAIANLAMLKTTSPICVYTSAPADIILDLVAVTP